MPKVQEAFDELVAQVLGQTVAQVQYQELRRSFFAGVLWAIVELELTAFVDDDPEGEKCVAHMMGLKDECVQFGRLIEAGKR